MGLRSQLGRAVALASRTARRSSTPANTQAADGATYSRPSTGDSVELDDVGLGRLTRQDENDDDLIVREDQLREVLIAVDDLQLAGSRTAPAAGDRIEIRIQHDDGDPHAASGSALLETLTFEVARTPSGEGAWRYVDPARTTYRLFAKLILETDSTLNW